LSGGSGDGQDRAEYGTGAEAREPVNRAQSKGRSCGLSSDFTREARENTEPEATPEELQNTQQDDDGARERYEGAPLPVDEAGHG
jgi:hypothetical protein